MKTRKTIDLIGLEELKGLMDYENGPCVSIYLETHNKGREIQQDPIRFKNLLRNAEEELIGDKMRPNDARALLEPGRNLLDVTEFWAHQETTLALFLAPGVVKVYRLPIQMESRVGVDRMFHVIPLVQSAQPDTKFFVLSLNKEGVRLLEGSRYAIEEIKLENVPTGLREFLADTQVLRSNQYHTGTGSTSKDGRKSAIHHGQGDQDDKNDKIRLLHFFQCLDEGIRNIFPAANTPLVLAGQPYVIAIYREASHIKNWMEGGIETNPSGLTDVQLHDRAWEKVAPILEEPKSKAREQFLALEGLRSGKADVRFQVVLPASHYQKVDTLFVPYDKGQWGLLNQDTNEVALHSRRKRHDTELLNRMAVNTFRYGGTVYPVRSDDVPMRNEVAAILR